MKRVLRLCVEDAVAYQSIIAVKGLSTAEVTGTASLSARWVTYESEA